MSTDIIVGFSGETKEEFKETEKAFKELKFDMAYINQFSMRGETYALLKMEDTVSKKKKGEGKKINQHFKKKSNKKYIGRILDVLVLEKKKITILENPGTTEQLNLSQLEKNLIGEFVKVKITDALSFGLKGRSRKANCSFRSYCFWQNRYGN